MKFEFLLPSSVLSLSLYNRKKYSQCLRIIHLPPHQKHPTLETNKKTHNNNTGREFGAVLSNSSLNTPRSTRTFGGNLGKMTAMKNVINAARSMSTAVSTSKSSILIDEDLEDIERVPAPPADFNEANAFSDPALENNGGVQGFVAMKKRRALSNLATGLAKAVRGKKYGALEEEDEEDHFDEDNLNSLELDLEDSEDEADDIPHLTSTKFLL